MGWKMQGHSTKRVVVGIGLNWGATGSWGKTGSRPQELCRICRGADLLPRGCMCTIEGIRVQQPRRWRWKTKTACIIEHQRVAPGCLADGKLGAPHVCVGVAE